MRELAGIFYPSSGRYKEAIGRFSLPAKSPETIELGHVLSQEEKERLLNQVAEGLDRLFAGGSEISVTQSIHENSRVRAHVGEGFHQNAYDVGVVQLKRDDQLMYLVEQYFPYTGADEENFWCFIPEENRVYFCTKDLELSTRQETKYTHITDNGDEQLIELRDIVTSLRQSDNVFDNENLQPHQKGRFSLPDLQ